MSRIDFQEKLNKRIEYVILVLSSLALCHAAFIYIGYILAIRKFFSYCQSTGMPIGILIGEYFFFVIILVAAFATFFSKRIKTLNLAFIYLACAVFEMQIFFLAVTLQMIYLHFPLL